AASAPQYIKEEDIIMAILYYAMMFRKVLGLSTSGLILINEKYSINQSIDAKTANFQYLLGLVSPMKMKQKNLLTILISLLLITITHFLWGRKMFSIRLPKD
ncbi:MAG: hypothetical protein MUF15_23495, partial [Acidobacteria bacterium]|nr:hypothetical protein [Acidobacteriota bacterium]